MKNHTILAAIAVTLGFAASAQAHAEGANSDTPRIAVSYRDLDLSRPSARETLDHRLSVAVRRVCGGQPDALELAKQRLYRDCSERAWVSVHPQLAAAVGRTNLAQSVELAQDKR